MIPVDALLQFRLLEASEGGRTKGLGGPDALFFACPLISGGNAWDCRVLIGGEEIALGETYTFPVTFLSREAAWDWAKPGTQVDLWEGKVIGHGVILEQYLEQREIDAPPF